MHALHEELRTETRTLNEVTRTRMRVLHEEMLSRLTQIGEHQSGASAAHPGRPAEEALIHTWTEKR